MQIAIQRYEREGWTVEDVSSRQPFDLSCSKGNVELRVEVKGTTGDGSTIQLTVGEVKSARMSSTELFIVHDIQLSGTLTDPVASGGTIKRAKAWMPLDEDLSPMTFGYLVPVNSG